MAMMEVTENYKKSTISQKMDNFKMVDIIKYVAAIMVICVHCTQIFSSAELNFFVKQIVCRTAVPFFFITSAFFVRKGCSKRPGYVKDYLKKTMRSYLLWSLVFIPIGLDWIYQNLDLAGNLLPFALLYGLFHIGTYYHLWYVPALLFSLYFVHCLLKRYSYKVLFFIAAIFFLFGSMESYYGLLPSGWFKDFFDMLIKIIFTTRSGLLYGVMFVLIGFYIYDYQDKLKNIINYVPILTILSATLLILEGAFLYNITRLDMNFLIMLVPFSFFFFLWILSFPYRPKLDTTRVRALSKYYYFVHPVCIIIIEQIGIAYHMNFLSSGFFSFLLVILMTHVLSSCILASEKPLNHRRILYAILSAIVITFIMASLFSLFRDVDTVLKFEFVPCIWFFTSFIMYAIFTKYYNRASSQT